MSEASTNRTRRGAAAGLLGAAAAFTLITGAGPAPSVFELTGSNGDISGNCDEAEHANDPECAGTPSTRGTVDDGATSTTTDDSTSTTAASGTTNPTADVRAIDAGGAGTVLVAVDGGTLRLVAATPTSGWRVEVEQASGREIEVDFRSGTRRVQVKVELEDGQVRERMRVRDDADGTDIRTEDGIVVRDDPTDSGNRGPGSGDDDSTDDNSGFGSGDDDPADDSSGSGSGGDGSNDDGGDDD